MRRRCLVALLPLGLLAPGCENNLGTAASGLQSLRLTLKQCTYSSSADGGAGPVTTTCTGDLPFDHLGTPDAPLNPTPRYLTFDVEAIDAKGSRLTADFDVDVFLSFSGNKVGYLDPCAKNEDSTPLATVHMTGGFAAQNTVPLVRAFGTVTLWLEERVSHALGTSPIFYFPHATIPDVQQPLDLASPTATYCSPWDGRHAIIDKATGTGQLVVTSVFGSAYVVADTGAIWDPKTNTGGYNHMYVYSFGRPSSDLTFDPVKKIGSVIHTFSGNVSKFVGFTELNFPLQEATKDVTGTVVMGAIPDVIILQASDRAVSISDTVSQLKLLKISGATVQVTGGVCAIDPTLDPWRKFNQFAIDMGDGVCDVTKTFAVELPGKTFGTLDPLKTMGTGKQVTITGMLKNSSGQNEACKGLGHDAPIICRTSIECQTILSMDPQYPPACGTKLTTSTCIEGTCKRGVFNFWTILPRVTSDIAVHL